MEPAVQKYLSTIGRRGGKKSKRSLSPGAARDMVRVREARRAYRQFHAQCFWSFDPNYHITSGDVPWVAERLRTHGGPLGYQLGVRLCR